MADYSIQVSIPNQGPKGDNGGIPEAPEDGVIYGRKGAEWVNAGLTSIFSEAEFYDRFERADTAEGVVSAGPTGQPYTVFFGPTGTGKVQISNNTLYSVPDGATWYVGGVFVDQVKNMGARVRWEAGTTADANIAQAVFLAHKVDEPWLSYSLHVVFFRNEVRVEVFNNYVLENLQTFVLPRSLVASLDIFIPLEIEIENDTVRVYVNGAILGSVTDVRVSACTGSFTVWEGIGQSAANGSVRYDEIWVNSTQALNLTKGRGVQPFSPTLQELALNIMRRPQQILINSQVDGVSRRATAGSGTIVSNTTSFANTSDAEVDAMPSSVFLAANTLARSGDRLRMRYIGTFAANANEKRVRWSVAGGPSEANSGLRTTSGGTWQLDYELTLLDKATNSVLARYSYEDAAGRVSGGNVSTWNVALTYDPRLWITGESANDVVVRSFFHEWLPPHMP